MGPFAELRDFFSGGGIGGSNPEGVGIKGVEWG